MSEPDTIKEFESMLRDRIEIFFQGHDIAVASVVGVLQMICLDLQMNALDGYDEDFDEDFDNEFE